VSATVHPRLALAARRTLLAAAAFAAALAIGPAVRHVTTTGDPANTPRHPRGLALRISVALSAAVLLAAAARARPDRRVGFAVASIVTAATLYGAEVALLWWGSMQHDTRRAIVNDLRGRGVPIFPAMAPRWTMDRPEMFARHGARGPLLPLGYPSRSVVVDCREANGWMIYGTDEHGFNNPTGQWSGAQPDVLVVGDSYANGACVDRPRTMTGRLRERYPRVINMGVNGNGPLFMLGGLREALAERRPRHVVWSYFAGNDLLDLRAEATHPILSRYLDPLYRQELWRRQDEVDRVLKGVVDENLNRPWWRRDGFVANALLLRTLRARTSLLGELWAPTVRFPDFDTSEADYALFARALAAADAAVRAAGGRMTFAYLPSWTEQYGEERSRGLAATRRERVMQIVRAAGLPIADVHAAFAADDDPGLHACPNANCHFSPEGYAVAASVVLETLAAVEREDAGAGPQGALERRRRSSTLPLSASASGS
jgi:hypothetical protein